MAFARDFYLDTQVQDMSISYIVVYDFIIQKRDKFSYFTA